MFQFSINIKYTNYFLPLVVHILQKKNKYINDIEHWMLFTYQFIALGVATVNLPSLNRIYVLAEMFYPFWHNPVLYPGWGSAQGDLGPFVAVGWRVSAKC